MVRLMYLVFPAICLYDDDSLEKLGRKRRLASSWKEVRKSFVNDSCNVKNAGRARNGMCNGIFFTKFGVIAWR